MARNKRHHCPVCAKDHVENIADWPVNSFTYQKINGEIYISAGSVFRMFTRMSLDTIALRFWKAVNELYFKKD